MHRFSYVKYDQPSIDAQAKLKAKFEEIEALVEDTMENGRPKSLVMTHLEEAYMWTGKGIRDAQIALTGRVDEQPERNNE